MLVAADRFVDIAGYRVSDLGFERAASTILERLENRRKLAVFFANAHFITVCRPLRAEIDEPNRVLLLNDGVGLNLASFLRRQRLFKENLNGTDFVPALLARLGRPVRIFLLGSRPRSAQGAAAAFAALPDVTIAGWCDGYSFWNTQAATLAAINAARPDIVLVALGSPTQERWILENMRQIEAPLIFGVGALFDYVSKQRRRAPRFIRQLNLEWLYRLACEPRRLAYRYTVELIVFAALVVESCMPF